MTLIALRIVQSVSFTFRKRLNPQQIRRTHLPIFGIAFDTTTSTTATTSKKNKLNNNSIMSTSPKKVEKHGRWQSPITIDLMTKSSLSISETQVNEFNGCVYHIENRPWENRSVVVERRISLDFPSETDVVRDINPVPFNAR